MIAKIGTGGGQGHVIEYRGSAIEALSMEGRMTICNMSIEAGARAGMVAPDETTYEFLRGRPHAPTGADWDAAVAAWDRLRRRGRRIRHRGVHRRRDAEPVRHVGHQPRAGRAAVGIGAGSRVDVDDAERQSAEKALAYMDLQPGTAMRDIAVDTCSWARAPTAASKICAWWPTYCVAERSPTACGCWLCPVPCGARAGRIRGARRDLHRRGRGVATGRLLDVSA